MAFYRRRPRPDAEKCADPAKARASALETLAGQEVSANILYERLCRRYTEQAAAAAVAEMVQLDYVNDARYAEARAHSLLAARKSRRAAAQSLRQKGLAPAEVAGALEAVYAPGGRRRPGAGSRRRAGGQPLPQKAGHRPPRPCGGCPAAPRLCLPRHQGSHPQGGGGGMTLP